MTSRPSRVHDQLQRPGVRALLGASMVSTTGALPVFMVAALVVLVRSDLGLTEAEFGLAVSVFFGTAALVSAPVGFATERLGGSRALAIGALLSALSMLGIANSNTLVLFAAWMWVAGLGHVTSQLGANHQLSAAIAPRRQGLAFGIRQSGPPMASLLAGLSVPWTAALFGWRVAVLLAACIPLVLAIAHARDALGGTRPKPLPASRPPTTPVTLRGRLGLYALAAIFVTAPLTALAAFVVDHAVQLGMSPGAGGLMLSAASVTAILVRLLVGWGADRTNVDPIRSVIAMLLVGSLALFAVGRSVEAAGLVLATTLAYGLGWGWPGAFILGIVRGYPTTPAAATGIPQMGMFAGGAIGPTAFGVLVVRYGYDVAWNVTAGSMLLGSVLLALGTKFTDGQADPVMPANSSNLRFPTPHAQTTMQGDGPWNGRSQPGAPPRSEANG